mgnify:FL=1
MAGGQTLHSQDGMKRIGEILIEDYGLTSTAFESALQAQKESGDLIGEILKKNGEVDEVVLLQALGRQFGIEVRRNLPTDINTDFTEKVPIGFLKQYKLVPVITPTEQFIAINNPFTFQPLDDLRALLEKQSCQPVLTPSHQIINAINFAYDMTQTSADEVMQDIDDEDPERLFSEIEEIGDLLDDADDL